MSNNLSGFGNPVEFGLLCGLIVALFVINIYCGIKESKVTGVYVALGVYTRRKAYWFWVFPFTGIVAIVYGIDAIVENKGGALIPLVCFGLAALFILISYLILRSVYKKCPNGLKKRVLLDMTVSGIGVAAKIGIIVFPLIIHSLWSIIWEINKPRYVLDENNRKLMVVGGDEVYDEQGSMRIGTLRGDVVVKN
jgi:hypothetical protein